MFIKYKVEVENQLDKRINRLHSERGGEYDMKTVRTFCEENGIIYEGTSPDTPKQNVIAERKKYDL